VGGAKDTRCMCCNLKVYFFLLSAAFTEGKGTSIDTKGTVKPTPVLSNLASNAASLLAAPPTVTDGSLIVDEQPTRAIVVITNSSCFIIL